LAGPYKEKRNKKIAAKIFQIPEFVRTNGRQKLKIFERLAGPYKEKRNKKDEKRNKLK
jgi:hypothetical protein